MHWIFGGVWTAIVILFSTAFAGVGGLVVLPSLILLIPYSFSAPPQGVLSLGKFREFHAVRFLIWLTTLTLMAAVVVILVAFVFETYAPSPH